MSNIAEFAVQLTARTGKFTHGMRQAERPVNRFARTVTMASRRIAGLGAIAGTVALGGLARMVKGSFATIDATSKLADNLGLTTRQLIGYQHAAKLSGVTNEQLGTAFKRMLKNISDAGLGLTTAKRAFAALGLSAAALERLSPDQQFKSIADALNRVELQSDKARIAQDLFGRSGISLLKMAESGSVGLAALQREAEKLGLTFDRLGGAKVEVANDALARTGSIFTGMANTLAIELAPALTDIADRFNAWATAGEGAAARVRKALDDVLPVINAISSAFNFVKGSILGGVSRTTGIAGFIPSLLGSDYLSNLSKVTGQDARTAMQRVPGIGSLVGGSPAGAVSQAAGRPDALLSSYQKALLAPTSGIVGQSERQIIQPFDVQRNLASAGSFGSGARELQAPGLALPERIDRVVAHMEDLLRLGEKIEENTALAV